MKHRLPLFSLPLLALLAAGLAALLRPAPAAEPRDNPEITGETLVSVDVRDGTLQDVLDALFDQGVNYTGVFPNQVGGLHVRARDMQLNHLVWALMDTLSRDPHHIAIWLKEGEGPVIVFRRRNEEDLRRDQDVDARNVDMDLRRREAEVEADIRQILRLPAPPDDLQP